MASECETTRAFGEHVPTLPLIVEPLSSRLLLFNAPFHLSLEAAIDELVVRSLAVWVVFIDSFLVTESCSAFNRVTAC